MTQKEKVSVAEQPISMTMDGYEVVEKVAKKCATSARILVPKHWIGKRVRAVRVDP
jgi:putative transposon-encoded protein